MNGLYARFEYNCIIFLGFLPRVSFRNRLTKKKPSIHQPLNAKKKNDKSCAVIDLSFSFVTVRAREGRNDTMITTSQFMATDIPIPSSVMISARYNHEIGPSVIAKEMINMMIQNKNATS